MNGSKVLVIGLAFKPDVDDMRESPTFKIFDLLRRNGAEVAYYDPYIPVIPESRDNKEWMGTQYIKWDKEIISSFDAVIISTNHSNINYFELVEFNECIIDTRNATENIKTKTNVSIFRA